MMAKSPLLGRRPKAAATLRTLLLLGVFAAPAWPCGCAGAGPSVKQAWKSSPAVFLGTVELADPDGAPREMIFQEQSVRLRVDEPFKGVIKGQIVPLQQGPTDCDAKFRTGERAVFYLHAGTKPGTWTVPPCSNALGSAEPDGDDLLFLRGLPQSARGTRLSGEVELYEDSPTEAFKRKGGVANVRVKISGPQGLTRETFTNRAGAYEAYGLSPGIYSVSIEVPQGLKLKFPVVTGSPPVPGDQAAARLGSDDGVSIGFVLQADTKVSGRMLDGKGAPVRNVCIDLEPAEGRTEDGARFFDCSKQDGSFKMEMMPPGDYWLIARDQVKSGSHQSTSTLYYPGVREKERADVISVRESSYATHLDIKLPNDEKRYRITGRVQFADGAPGAHATIKFTSSEAWVLRCFGYRRGRVL